MTYWLDLFTGTTWNEFRKVGAKITGFRHRMRNTVARIEPGDILLCYMTGVMRWVGALKVLGPSDDQSPIWSVADFPARLAVKPLVILDAEAGVPMSTLEGKVDFYRGEAERGKFRGFVRRSPNALQQEQDGNLILDLLQEAERNPTLRPVDPAKLGRKPLLKAETKKGKRRVETMVSIPDTEDSSDEDTTVPSHEDTATPHTQIQHTLLQLGADMGFDVWVARNDRGRNCNDKTLGQMPGMVDELPTQFNEATESFPRNPSPNVHAAREATRGDLWFHRNVGARREGPWRQTTRADLIT